jgi:hypothetical protein
MKTIDLCEFLQVNTQYCKQSVTRPNANIRLIKPTARAVPDPQPDPPRRFSMFSLLPAAQKMVALGNQQLVRREMHQPHSSHETAQHRRKL